MINPEIEEERLRLELRLTQLEAQDRSRKNFLDFVRYVWPEAMLGEHHKKMAAAFDRIANGTLKRLIVNMPPRHTKSEFASYLFPAFILGRDPRTQIIEATHTAELAVKFGRKVRDLVDDERYRELFPDVALKADSKAAGRWDTNKGGTYFAAGVGGALTGRGADLCLGGNTIVKVDDAEMRLSEVQVGQRIKTVFGWQEITNKALTIHKEKVKINDIEASLTHPFLTSEGWVHAGALKVGSRIKTETLWRRIWIGASFLLRPRPVRRGPA